MSASPSWLGPLPDDWSAVALKRVVSHVSRGLSPEYADDGLPVVNQACVYWNGLRTDNVKRHSSAAEVPAKAVLRDGDVLVNSTGTGTLGRALVFQLPNEQTWLADSHVTIVRTTADFEPRFLTYVLATDVYQGFILSVLAAGATNQIELSREGLRRMPVPFPGRDAQRAIADFLDRKTAAIDALIEKKERLIALLQEKRQALITQAVTKGLDPNVPVKDSGIEWLGQVPAHWDVARLRHVVVEAVAGPYGASLTKSMYSSAGYRVYGQQQVISNDFSVGDYYIDAEKFSEMHRYRVTPGDLLVSVMGTVGRAAVVPANAEPGIINPRLVRYRPDHRRTGAEWLRACILAHPWQSHLRLAAQGATMEGLNMKILGDLPVVLPGRVEQAEILEAVRKGDAQSAQLSARLDDSVGRLREYRQALITAAVAGQISVA